MLLKEKSTLANFTELDWINYQIKDSQDEFDEKNVLRGISDIFLYTNSWSTHRRRSLKQISYVMVNIFKCTNEFAKYS